MLGLLLILLFSSCTSGRYGHLTRKHKPQRQELVSSKFSKGNNSVDPEHKNAVTLLCKEDPSLDLRIYDLTADLPSKMDIKPIRVAKIQSESRKLNQVFSKEKIKRRVQLQTKASSGDGTFVLLGLLVIAGFVALMVFLGVVWWKVLLLILLAIVLGVIIAVFLPEAARNAGY